MSDALYPAPSALASVTSRWLFKNLKQESCSGKKKGLATWIYPLREFELQYDTVLDQTTSELKALAAFFLARRGAADSFLFDNPDDNFITAQQLGVGDNNATAFQLVRSYGGFIEPCLDIKSTPTPKIYLDAVLQSSGYALDLTDSGILTFTTHPGTGVVITAEFGFYWRCCFKEDLLEMEKFLSKLWKGKVSLETVK